MAVIDFPQGGYRYIAGVFQYSGGVAALPGFEIRRVRFQRPVPLAKGFEHIERIIKEAGRPLTSFCACELRSPAPFTDQGFLEFNKVYVVTLDRWGLYRDGDNPVARSNVCPEADPPAEPSFHAFSFAVESKASAPTFVVSGSGEAKEGPGSYSERCVRRGETSEDAMREKAQFVHGEMERRLKLLGVGWQDTTAIQVYTVHNLHPILADDIARRGAAPHGVTWQYCRPPVNLLEYEVDCRGVLDERVVPVG